MTTTTTKQGDPIAFDHFRAKALRALDALTDDTPANRTTLVMFVLEAERVAGALR